MSRGARAAALVALLSASVASLALAQVPEPPQSEESFNGAGCYGCHRVWSPVPMRTMFTIQPAEDTRLPVGTPGELGVRVEEAWVAKPPWPKLTHFEAFVDLANAPSLGFVSQQAPILGVVEGGTIDPTDDQGAPQPLADAEAYVVHLVPPGASDLVFTASANSTDGTLGPDLVLRVYPGRERPGTVAFTEVDAGGRGVAERFELHGGRNITALSPDSPAWTLEVVLKPVVVATPNGDERELQPEGRDIPFTVTMDAYRNLTGETRQFTVIDRIVEAGQSTILPFRLQATRPAAAGEHVLVTVNATAYYPHQTGGGKDDWGNFSKSMRLEASADGDAVVLGAGALATVAPAPVSRLPLDRVSEAVGYMAAFLIVSSIVSGGMFGKGSRRALNSVFGAAKRRVAFHNALSYFLMLAAVVHTVLFLVEANYVWTLGIIWGGIAILAMAGLGVTGAWQVAMVRRWGYGVWRWSHFGLAVAAILFTLVHMALDGANFGFVQDAVGWEDPFPEPRPVR